jgi:hypothetical protein
MAFLLTVPAIVDSCGYGSFEILDSSLITRFMGQSSKFEHVILFSDDGESGRLGGAHSVVISGSELRYSCRDPIRTSIGVPPRLGDRFLCV